MRKSNLANLSPEEFKGKSLFSTMNLNARGHRQEEEFRTMLSQFFDGMTCEGLEGHNLNAVKAMQGRRGLDIQRAWAMELLDCKPIYRKFEEEIFGLIEEFGEDIATISWDFDLPTHSGYTAVKELCGAYILIGSHCPAEGPEFDPEPLIKSLGLFRRRDGILDPR